MNHKQVYRLYCQEGLMLRNKKPKRHMCRVKGEWSGRWRLESMRAGPWTS